MKTSVENRGAFPSIRSSQQKILIVEDEETVANVFRNTFLVEGFSVEVASNGRQALEMVRDFKPDIMVLDLMIPEIDGVEVITRLRAEEITRKLPIVVCSNFYLSQMVEKAWKAGANFCLMKASCDRKQLIKVVQKALAPEGAANITASDNEPQGKNELYARAEEIFLAPSLKLRLHFETFCYGLSKRRMSEPGCSRNFTKKSMH